MLNFCLFKLLIFFLFFFFFGLKTRKENRILTWRSMLCIYLFIYLAPGLSPSVLFPSPWAFHGCQSCFFSLLFSPPTWGPSGDRDWCVYLGGRKRGDSQYLSSVCASTLHGVAGPWPDSCLQLLEGLPLFPSPAHMCLVSMGNGGGELLVYITFLDDGVCGVVCTCSPSRFGGCFQTARSLLVLSSVILYRGIKEDLIFFFYTCCF